MFNPVFEEGSKKNHKVLWTFAVLLLAVAGGISFFGDHFGLTGAVIYQSGEVQSFEPIFILIGGIILTFIIALIWWWISKKKSVAPRM
jgi:hypothetical protein